MRKIHTTLRLFFEAGLSIRAIARTLRVSLRIPVKPITRSGMKPITESGQADHQSERSDAGW